MVSCTGFEHMISDWLEFNDLFKTAVLLLPEVYQSGQLFGILVHLRLIQAVVATNQQLLVHLFLFFGKLFKLGFEASVFGGHWVVNEHQGISFSVKHALLKIISHHFLRILYFLVLLRDPPKGSLAGQRVANKCVQFLRVQYLGKVSFAIHFHTYESLRTEKHFLSL